MPRRKDIEVLEQPPSEDGPAQLRPARPPRLPQHDRYLRCPLCTRQAKVQVLRDGPYTPVVARDQHFGGRGQIAWDEPEEPTPAEATMLRNRVRRLMRALGLGRQSPAAEIEEEE